MEAETGVAWKTLNSTAVAAEAAATAKVEAKI
jgi:hypothetical protein